MNVSKKNALAIAVVLGALYGIALRIVMELETFETIFAAMSIAFLFGGPIGIGVISASGIPRVERSSIGTSLGVAVMSSLLCLVAAGVFAWEGAICLAIAAPAFISLAMVGATITWALNRKSSRLARNGTATLALLPLLISPLEQQVDATPQLREVRTARIIHASPEAVWRNIAEVPWITNEERTTRPSKWIGIPDPLEARLDAQRVGGTRLARFERGIEFREVITVWEPRRRLAFTISANTSEIGPAALDRHVLVGGEYFDVTYGEFTLHPIDREHVRLELVSRHRLSTHFNGYAGFFTDWIMADVQNHLLRVVQRRAERRRVPIEGARTSPLSP